MKPSPPKKGMAPAAHSRSQCPQQTIRSVTSTPTGVNADPPADPSVSPRSRPINVPVRPQLRRLERFRRYCRELPSPGTGQGLHPKLLGAADLGVKAGYADIYHASALIEISGSGVGSAPEPSFGTHFFQDLIESSIYPLAIFLDDEDVVYNRTFFYDTPNQLVKMFPREEKFAAGLRLISVQDYLPGSRLELVMDSEEGRAVAFLTKLRQ